MPQPYTIADLALPVDSEIAALIERCPDIASVRFDDGDYLMREGDDSQDTYLVLRGAYVVEQRQHNAGPDERGAPLAVVTAELDEPSFIGEMAYLDSNLRTASVRASGPVFTLVLSPAHVDVVLDQFPFFGRILSQQFARRLHEANGIIQTYRKKLDLRATHAFHNPGDVLVEAGTKADTLLQLIDGKVTRAMGDDEETIKAGGAEPVFLNALAFFATGINEATVTAKTNCIVVSIDAAAKEAAVRNFPEVVLDLLERSF